ncbi:leucine-rich repeat domain-containing protein [Simkania negevensis]|uniref:Leucine-rich repeat domain-containing protein n=1 Tax=Simkania negevensis TaxID=83561 RepID=A0ABS3AWU1_9BACT|nr:leucine-rich repeat domain-containing protein [Simkania negevensis]
MILSNDLIQPHDLDYWKSHVFDSQGKIQENVWEERDLKFLLPVIQDTFAQLLREPVDGTKKRERQIQLAYASRNAEIICRIASERLGISVSIDLTALQKKVQVSIKLTHKEELLITTSCSLSHLLDLSYFETMFRGPSQETEGELSLDLDEKEDVEFYRLFFSGVEKGKLLKPTNVKQACKLLSLGRYFGCPEEFLGPVYNFIEKTPLQKEEALHLAEHAYRFHSSILQEILSSCYLSKLNSNEVVSFLDELKNRGISFSSLVLKGCKLDAPLLAWFKQHANEITTLDISSAQLHDPAAWIEALSNNPSLKVLNISNTRITTLPQGCLNLEEVYAFDCRLLYDVSGLDNLKKLRKLMLLWAGITKLPTGCDNLEEVDTSGCVQLVDVSGLDDLKKLRILNLCHTGIVALPKGCVNLEKDEASQCVQLDDVSGLDDLKKLRLLILCGTRIIALPRGCVGLKEVNASQCVQLVDVSGLDDLKKLCTLYLFNTGITALPEGCDNLEEVDVASCRQLADVRALDNLKRLCRLRLSGSGVFAPPSGCIRLGGSVA